MPTPPRRAYHAPTGVRDRELAGSETGVLARRVCPTHGDQRVSLPQRPNVALATTSCMPVAHQPAMPGEGSTNGIISRPGRRFDSISHAVLPAWSAARCRPPPRAVRRRAVWSSVEARATPLHAPSSRVATIVRVAGADR